ncbi:MAG TPA: TetR/AcrR family transcriptional regulator [Deltaproteobacteria bacterium]|nr:TetR/AcrR family transcriptional regulator [Deltaproteobacteria bacterium]HPR54692.1 TetR/AcrR family transcriptional regulator [Deltaproteobacteria bacterium]HXK46644.1 TetR/AcrR family transcriptional regulator [Deltaproteobacteria bacterium]
MKRRKGPHASTESRRRDIILAALKCFSEIGFSVTSMEDIRRQSGASTGSIYHHFKGKEQLAAEVYLEGIREYQAGLIEIFQSSRDAKEGIRALIEHHLKWVETNAQWSRYLFQMRHSDFLASTESDISGMNRDLAGSASEWFSRHIGAGKLRKLPQDIYMSLILGPCMEHTRQYLSGHAVTGTDRAVDELAEAAWRALATGAG